MSSTATKFGASDEGLADSNPAKLFHWVIVGLLVGGLCIAVPRSFNSRAQLFDVGIWVVASLLADLMIVRIGRNVSLSMSLPVLLAAGFFHAPAITGLIAFLGCLDPAELKGKRSIERLLFNRSQIAAAAGAACFVMHLGGPTALEWPAVVGTALAGLITDCIVNVGFVATSTVLSGRDSWGAALKGMWGAEPTAYLLLYVSMALIAPLLGLIYVTWGAWALLSCTAVLIPFRLAFARIENLGVTLDVVRLREAALKKAYASAELERRDERLVLAGDLHDEVLPALFKVHLMGEVLKQDLASGRLLDLDEDLPELLEATNAAQLAVRSVVGDLRLKRSGPRGIVNAIRSCADQQEGDGKPRFTLHLSELRGSSRAELVLVQVAHEAMVNASRYSNATRITVELSERTSGFAELLVEDDGDGFEPFAVDTTAHFGLQLMRDRVEAAGGALVVSSQVGRGTTVSAVLPLEDLDIESDA